MRVIMSHEDLVLLLSILRDKQIDTRTNVLQYEEPFLTVPDAIAAQVQAITGAPNWRVLGAQTTLRKYASTARAAKETGGISVLGAAIPTDAQARLQLSEIHSHSQANPADTVYLKKSDGAFVSLNHGQVHQVALAIARHTHACAAAEASAVAGVLSGTIDSAAQIDAIFTQVSQG